MRLFLSRCITANFCAIENYGISSRIGGSSSEGLYEIYAGKFQNKALEKVKSRIINESYGTNIITTKEECLKCL